MKQVDDDNIQRRLSCLEKQVSEGFTSSVFGPGDFVGRKDEVDLVAIVNALWLGKWRIFLSAGIFSVVAVVTVLLVPNEYKATALLAPASSSSSSLSSLAGKFGGIASLAGISLGGNESGDKSVVAMELIRTWGFIEEFIESEGIAPEVYAVKRWDASSNELVYDDGLYDIKRRTWKDGEGVKPTSWELYEEFVERISVTQDKGSGLITLSVEHYSPALARNWVNKIISKINRHLKEADRAEALKSIEYLTGQIESTNIAEMKNVFYQLIEEQTKTLMLAETTDEYALKIISPAKIPEEKSKPFRALICIVLSVVGFFFGVVFVLVQYVVAGMRKPN